MPWTWSYLDAGGAELPATADNSLTDTAFPTQIDAEAWLGESWQDLADDGVDAVNLFDEETLIYGPMSLRPA